MSTIRLELQRRLASTRRERLAVFALIAGASMAFALFLGWFVGAWMIVPFAGLEVGCVAIAFGWIERLSEDRDTIEIGDSSVSIVRSAARTAKIFRSVGLGFKSMWKKTVGDENAGCDFGSPDARFRWGST